MKICSICKEEKPRSDFYKSGGRCKECLLKYLKDLRQDNPEKFDEVAFKSRLKRFGLTFEQYEEMLIKQNYVCAICKEPQNFPRTDKLYIDHCHTSNKVRGLLCNGCNSGLGYFKDNPTFLHSAAEYLC